MKQNIFKRTNKNIIFIILIILLLISFVGTSYYAKSNLSNSANSMGETAMPNSGDSNQPPKIPSGDSSSMEEPPEIPNGNNPMLLTKGIYQKVELTTMYYIIFGIESLLLSCLIMYLIMSNFNKKTLKETFITSDKTIITIISIISIVLLTTVFIGGSILLSNNLLNNNSTINDSPNGNNNNSSISYSATTEINEDTIITSGSYESTTADENAILVSGDINTTLSSIKVNKTGDSDGGDNTSFYGINSAIISKDGANLTLKNIIVTTSAKGANAVFSYGGSATTNNTSSDGTTINISDSMITTTKDASGGIMTTGGGIVKASNLTITTSGMSSAAIRSDRGGGTLNVDGGTYTTNGAGSPTVYSTANISVKNASLIANVSEGIVIEGKNSVTLKSSTLTDTNNKLNGQSTTYKNIFLYQSMSGDADTGDSEFTATANTITTNKGDTFYITNTSAIITLTDNTFINNDSIGNFLRVQADSWGRTGSNGGEVILILNKQDVTGNIVIDSISTLDMELKNNSSYKGTINSDNSAKEINIKLDSNSKFTLTGNSYVTSLDNADTTNSNIDFNGYYLYVNGAKIN